MIDPQHSDMLTETSEPAEILADRIARNVATALLAKAGVTVPFFIIKRVAENHHVALLLLPSVRRPKLLRAC